jgi:putative membrane protein
MMRTSITMTLAAAAVAMIALPGTGTAKSMHGKHAKQGGATSTQEFVKHAAQGGMAEVELGRIAADKASDPDVKQFGQRMVDDHSKANDELKNLASSKGIQLPAKTDPKHQALIDRLNKLSGQEFDRAFMQAMTTDHNHDVAEFQRYARSGSDPEVKAWAEKTLPTLQDHQQLAKQTASKVGPVAHGKSTTLRGSSHAATGSSRKTAQGAGSANEH